MQSDKTKSGVLGIHPAQLEWLEATTRGEKIIWHASMHILECFAPEFDLTKEESVSKHVLPTHLHDLVYPLCDRARGVVGVQFWCLAGLLAQTDLLSSQDDGGYLAPLAIYQHGAEAYKKTLSYQALHSEKKVVIEEQDREAIRFLERYPLRVPYAVWSRALPAQSS